jgi:hypothetical protein
MGLARLSGNRFIFHHSLPNCGDPLAHLPLTMKRIQLTLLLIAFTAFSVRSVRSSLTLKQIVAFDCDLAGDVDDA